MIVSGDSHALHARHTSSRQIETRSTINNSTNHPGAGVLSRHAQGSDLERQRHASSKLSAASTIIRMHSMGVDELEGSNSSTLLGFFEMSVQCDPDEGCGEYVYEGDLCLICRLCCCAHSEDDRSEYVASLDAVRKSLRSVVDEKTVDDNGEDSV